MQLPASTRQSGLTLIETLFTVAIVAVLAGFASNSVSAAVQAAHSSNGLSSLIAALTRARSSAANLGVDVVLRPSHDGVSCMPGDHWESGWIAFAATHSGSDRTSDEPILLRQGALPPKMHLVTRAGRTRIRFQPSGSNAGSNATFTLCDRHGPAKATAYAMANNGNLHATALDTTYVADPCSAG